MRLVGLAALIALVVASPAPARTDLPPADEINKAFDVRSSSVQTIVLPTGEDWAPFLAPVNLAGQDVELLLEPHRVRSTDSFQVLTIGEGGKVTQVNDPSPTTYAGTIQAIPGARVRASLRGAQLRATIWLPGGEVYFVQPVSDAVTGVDPADHVVYRGLDSIQPINRCGVGVENVNPAAPGAPAAALAAGAGPGKNSAGVRTVPAPAAAGSSGPAAARGPTVKIAEISFDNDFEYYTLLGSNVTNVVNDVESMMNSIEGVYEGESVNCQYEVTTIIVRTANAAPYSGITNAGALLNAMQNDWNGNPLLTTSLVRRDVTHMFTNKPIDNPNGTIGIAFLSTACNTASAYGLSKSRWSANLNNRISVTSHELGHNFSATHCNTGIGEACSGLPTCGMMCASIGGCGGSIVQFGACSAGQVINYRDTSGGCLSVLAPPINSFPFFDGFDGGVVPANWVWNYNASSAFPVAALQPAPTPNLALGLNAATSGATTFRDEIRSNFFNLAGAAPTTEVSFRWARSTVPAGAHLFVDYWANNLRWVNLLQLTSDGGTSAGWTLQRLTLPAAGLHSEARIRFRVDIITTTAQIWYVDNFRIGAPLPVNCNVADITEIGGTAEAPGDPDGQLTVDDIIVFINLFGDGTGCPGPAPCSRADVTGIGGSGAPPDGELTVDDVIEFFNAFSDGC